MTMTSKNRYDLVIVGGGPSGMWASYYAAYRKLKVLLIEQTGSLGGMPLNNYPDKSIYDIPGMINVDGKTLISKLKEQMDLQAENIEILLNESISRTKKVDDLYNIELENNGSIHSKCILYCNGVGRSCQRTLSKEITNDVKVFNNVANINEFKGCDIAISGGGDSALDYSLLFSQLNRSNIIYLIHRRDEFRGNESKVKEIKQRNNIIIKTSYIIKSLQKNNNKTNVVLEKDNSSIDEVIVDKVLVQHGIVIERNVISVENNNLLLDVDNINKYYTNEKFESSLDGLYVSSILSNKFAKNLIHSSISNATTAICDMIDKYFDKRSKIY